MNLNHEGSGQILVGDLFHWQLGSNGYFVIEENCRAVDAEFQTMNLDEITEDIVDA
jgi:hypothetical protein